MSPRTKRIARWSCAALLAVALIAIVVVLLALDGILRRTVASQSTASLNLTTRLDSANLSLRAGQLSLGGLSIASPKGFAAADMFALKNAAISVSYGQLVSQPMHIRRIVLQKPTLIIEQHNGRMNVLAALQGMPRSDSADSSRLRLIIDAMEIDQTTVILRPGIPLLKPQYTFVLPTIALQDIGNDDGAAGGAAIKDVMTLVLTVIMQKAGESGSLPMGVGAMFPTASATASPAPAARPPAAAPVKALADTGTPALLK